MIMKEVLGMAEAIHKPIQFRLEQQKENYKNEFPFTHHSIKADKALVTLRRSIESNCRTAQKNRNYYFKKDVLNLLSPEKEKNVYSITEAYRQKKFDQDKYPNDFYKKLKKKFPQFTRDYIFDILVCFCNNLIYTIKLLTNY